MPKASCVARAQEIMDLRPLSPSTHVDKDIQFIHTPQQTATLHLKDSNAEPITCKPPTPDSSLLAF